MQLAHHEYDLATDGDLFELPLLFFVSGSRWTRDPIFAAIYGRTPLMRFRDKMGAGNRRFHDLHWSTEQALQTAECDPLRHHIAASVDYGHRHADATGTSAAATELGIVR